MSDSSNPLADLAAPVSVETRKATYTATHAVVKDGDVSMVAVTRDTDGVPFVAVTRGKGDDAKTRYDRADRVARYLQLLAAK